MRGDALRSELVFLDEGATAERFDDAVVVRTPSNPTYWWGNTIAFDGPPAEGDFARWTALFTAHFPQAEHATFSWEGDAGGVAEPFVDADFEVLETVILGADRGSTITAPHVDPTVTIEACVRERWDALVALQLETREAYHAEADYRPYIERRVACWRRLAQRGQGAYYGAWQDGSLLAAAGVFVEAARGADGRRIGRFQNVSTRPSARRRGLAGMLVAAATREAFDRFDADRVLILADENDAPRRVYESVGFRASGLKRGLQRAP